MRNALRAEIARLTARRLTLVALLGLLLLIGLFQLQVGSMVKPPSAAAIAPSQADYQEYVRDWEENHEQWEADCVASGGSPADCEIPRPEPSDYGLAPTPYDQVVSGAVSFGVYLGGMVVFLVAASFIGAEFSTGSLANWLTFVPDRRRVFVSKLLVVVGFAVAVGLVVAVVTVGVSALVTSAFGQPLTGLGTVTATAARGVVVTAVFGILGFCVALLTGSTGAATGVLLGAFFLTYVRMVLSFATRWAQHLAPWSPDVNLTAILQGKATYSLGDPTSDGSQMVERTVGLAQGLGYWAVLLALVVGVSWVLFRRRDIT